MKEKWLLFLTIPEQAVVSAIYENVKETDEGRRIALGNGRLDLLKEKLVAECSVDENDCEDFIKDVIDRLTKIGFLYCHVKSTEMSPYGVYDLNRELDKVVVVAIKERPILFVTADEQTKICCAQRRYTSPIIEMFKFMQENFCLAEADVSKWFARFRDDFKLIYNFGKKKTQQWAVAAQGFEAFEFIVKVEVPVSLPPLLVEKTVELTVEEKLASVEELVKKL